MTRRTVFGPHNPRPVPMTVAEVQALLEQHNRKSEQKYEFAKSPSRERYALWDGSELIRDGKWFRRPAPPLSKEQAS